MAILFRPTLNWKVKTQNQASKLGQTHALHPEYVIKSVKCTKQSYFSEKFDLSISQITAIL